ncbi:lytic transglycosylase domain-containing protein [Bartonella taylorii]|uniref:lytic transglycosylase domain-containing protein n=1 Tax=Bartonella taylorii TaxID=33046 RepID=UPI001ABB7289|nr:lytic transglycosylase domain-containing protein [Bartonella taylorii]
MTIPNFMMLLATCAPTIHPTTFPAVVMQKSQDYVYVIGFNDCHKLSHQPSTFQKEIATAEKLMHNCHNFDISLGQINVNNLELVCTSYSDLFDPCKNLKAAQVILTYCYKQAVSKYSFERTALQAALSYYKTRNFNGGFSTASVQKVSSHTGVKVPTLVGEELQETLQLHTKGQEHIIETEPLLPSSEEPADVFTHKASGVRDAFTAEDPSSLEKQQE